MLQVVDLQESKEFEALDVQLLSIAPDPPAAWREAAAEFGVPPGAPLLSDEGNRVASEYGVMRWQAATGEPGHTFILVDEDGRVSWVKDYGAPEHGGVMYVAPQELLERLRPELGEA